MTALSPITPGKPVVGDPLVLAFQAIDQAPHDPRCRFALWQALSDRGSNEQAAEVFGSLLRLVERDVEALTGFGQMYLHIDRVTEARRLFDQALAKAPEFAPALVGMSAVSDRKGDRKAAASLLDRYVRVCPIVPAARDAFGPHVTRLRCLLSTRYEFSFNPQRGFRERFRGGHFSTEHLLNGSDFQITTVNLAGDAAPLDEAPSATVMINTIACADRGQQSLAAVGAYLKGHPEINCVNRPDRVLNTSRDTISHQLQGMPYVVCPITQRIRWSGDTSAIVRDIEAVTPYPAIVRRVGTHTGESMALVADRGKLVRHLHQLELDTELYVTAFAESRDVIGIYRKARAFLVNGTLFPVALLGNDEWQIHSGDRYRIMADDPRLQSEERSYLDDPEGTLGSERWTALTRVCQSTGLDFVGVDFAPVEDGVLIFEVNAAMRHNFDHATNFPYTRPHLQRVSEAFAEMIKARTTS